VFVSDPASFTAPEGVHATGDAQSGTADVRVAAFGARLIGCAKFFVQDAPRIDRCVRDPDLLHLFEIEDPLTVQQCMQRHYADERRVVHIRSCFQR
jgi:hypothetical protein